MGPYVIPGTALAMALIMYLIGIYMSRDHGKKKGEAREYEAFLHGKVEIARVSMRADHGRTNDEVEAIFAAKRRKLNTIASSYGSTLQPTTACKKATPGVSVQHDAHPNRTGSTK